MKKLVLTLLGLLLVLGLTGCGGGDQPAKSQNQDQVKLGIIQIVQHPSLDAARQGFLDVLKENGYVDGQKLAVDYQNAQGDQANLQTIARKFVQG